MPSLEKFSKEKILAALTRLNERLHGKGAIGEFCIVDNATKVNTFEMLNVTYNLEVDSVTKRVVLNCARQVAERFDLEEDWINSSAGDFISELEEITHEGTTISFLKNRPKNPVMITNSHETTLYESMLFVSNSVGSNDAYLASTAAHVCQKRGVKSPSWVNQPSRVLEKPWFAAKSHNLRMIFLQESPVTFRIRNLFVSANALSRAWQYAAAYITLPS